VNTIEEIYMNIPLDQQELLPSQDDIEFYRTHGWYISKKIFSDEELDSAIKAQEDYYSGRQEILLCNGKRNERGGIPEPGNKAIRMYDLAGHTMHGLRNLYMKPILGAIAGMISGKSIRLWHEQLLYKPPTHQDTPNNVGWHTDKTYWGSATSTDMLTAWIPFHDCDEKRGPIAFIDGSHKWSGNNHLNFFSNDMEGLEDKINHHGNEIVKVPAVMERGQVSFHHCLTIHGSGSNLTNQPRRSIAIHMQDTENRHSGTGTHNDDFFPLVDGVVDYQFEKHCPMLFKHPVVP